MISSGIMCEKKRDFGLHGTDRFCAVYFLCPLIDVIMNQTRKKEEDRNEKIRS